MAEGVVNASQGAALALSEPRPIFFFGIQKNVRACG